MDAHDIAQRMNMGPPSNPLREATIRPWTCLCGSLLAFVETDVVRWYCPRCLSLRHAIVAKLELARAELIKEPSPACEQLIRDIDTVLGFARAQALEAHFKGGAPCGTD